MKGFTRTKGFACLFFSTLGFSGGWDSKESACNAEDTGSIPGSGRPPGEGNGYPLQYSCLENSMNRGAWQSTVHGVAEDWGPWGWSDRTEQLTHTHFPCCFSSLCKGGIIQPSKQSQTLRAGVSLGDEDRLWRGLQQMACNWALS